MRATLDKTSAKSKTRAPNSKDMNDSKAPPVTRLDSKAPPVTRLVIFVAQHYLQWQVQRVIKSCGVM